MTLTTQSGEQIVAQIAALVAGEYVDDGKMIAPVRNPIGNGERELHSVSECVGEGCILATPR